MTASEFGLVSLLRVIDGFVLHWIQGQLSRQDQGKIHSDAFGSSTPTIE